MKNELDHMSEKIDRISIQFDYVRRSFTIAIKALEEICDVEESLGKVGSSPYRIAQKTLRSVKALADEACTEED